MERSNKRGKIPHQDWPSILARYEAGETLANIARTYGCSAPAVSYIVSRSRARGAVAAPSAPTPPEPQLIKSHPAELYSQKLRLESTMTGRTPPNNSVPHPPQHNTEGGPNRTEEARLNPSIRDDGEKKARGGSPPSSDLALVPIEENASGRKLHLPPSYADGPRSGTGAQSNRGDAGTSADGSAAPPTPAVQDLDRSVRREANGTPMRLIPEPRISADGGTFIDRSLRERVEADIAMFLDAFDAALAQDTSESRSELREATDRLLRAGARTRIELERLEARLPLPQRNGSKQHEPAGWRR